jgi:putative ABC transport system permease protein
VGSGNSACSVVGYLVPVPIGGTLVSGDTEWAIIGVVGDVLHQGLAGEATPTFYSHIPQAPRSRQSYIIRTQGDPMQLLGSMRAVVEAVDAGLPVSEMLPLSALVAEESAQPRFLAAIISSLALLGLVLATLGVYGVLAYLVRGRSREIGLRTALGASRPKILREVVGSGMRPALIGLAGGLGVAALLSRYLGSLLFGVRPLDPPTFILVAVLLSIAAFLACLFPATAAAGVDPRVSLSAD